MIIKSVKILLCFCAITNAFNLSPAPNIIIKKPQLSTFIEQTRSSYFGFQINLRKNHLIVAAPRQQSTLEQQRKVNETGVIFKCTFDDDSQSCHPYHFDLNGNTRVENDLAYNSEKKDFQLLGFSMDGNENEDDRLVVCAPKLMADLEESEHYLLHGICYWVSATNTSQPSGVRQINPLRQKNLQTMPGEDPKVNYYYYIYGQSGFSVHVSDDNEEIIIGAVGILNWRGSIIRYRGGKRPDLGGLSRRELNPYRHILRRRQVIEYRSEIPSPFFSSISDDSYFGYAVSTAKFLGPDTDLLYVASAPQSNHQTGEVFIFDIDDYRFEKKIKVFNKFIGDKFGEYFGYSLICEDFNGDQLPDLAVAAPLHSKNGLYENGAVYVFINRGNLAFDKQPLILSDFDGNGRFGTTMSRIGDINLDGYNDLAISAPFEENGAVYIYLGNAQGLSNKFSQKIKAPSELLSSYEGENISNLSTMFGLGLSKGVDIDSNGYRDLAIGSPNSETVYIFKTYPVVKVIASITSSKTELSLEDNTIIIKVCTALITKTEINREIEFETSLMLDMKYNRASFSPRESEKMMNHTAKINQEEECNDYTVYVKGTISDIFKPLTVDFRYDVIEKVPEYSHTFCESCVSTDPNDAKIITKKIPFSTGCGQERCVSDLALVGTLVNVKQPYVLGSTKTIEIKYEISNSGESAYLTQLSIMVPTNITEFSRIPSSCRIHDAAARDVMICDINHGKPIHNQKTTDIVINLDATRLDGNSLKIIANCSSAGDERKPSDNLYINEIILTEFSDLELNGVSSGTQFSLEDGLRVENLQYKYKVYNNGPSTIKELSIRVFVPIMYTIYPNYFVPIVNISDLSVMGFYINKVLDYSIKSQGDWFKVSGDVSSKNSDFDSSKMGYDYDMNAPRTDQDYNTLGQSSHRRKRNSLDEEQQLNYNRYTQSLIEEEPVTYRSSVDKEDATIANLPRNRTIILDCMENSNECVEVEFFVRNFRPGSEAVVLNFNFSMDLSKMDEIFNEKQNIFLYKFNAKATRISIDENTSSYSTLKINLRNPYTIIYEKFKSKTPIWIFVVSIIVGLLILILLSYSLYKLGFFKRAQKEELEKMVRESRNITSEQAEELRNLNT